MGSALRVYDTIPEKYMKMKPQSVHESGYVKKNTDVVKKPSAL